LASISSTLLHDGNLDLFRSDEEKGAGILFLDLVKKRTSTRRYSQIPVDRKDLDRCIEAARLAPSACNSQPWSFVISDDPERNHKICSSIFSGPYRMNRFAEEAPVLIFIKTERSRYSAMFGGLFRGTTFSLIDIGIACEHLVLQATELGLGTCWIGWFNEKALKKELGLSGKHRFDIVLTMGYPVRDNVPSKKRKDIESIRRYL